MAASQRLRDYENYLRNRTDDDLRAEAAEDAEDIKWLDEHPFDPDEPTFPLEEIIREFKQDLERPLLRGRETRPRKSA